MIKTLVCTVCLKEKPIELFLKSKLVKCGYTSRCKECNNKIMSERAKYKNFPPIEEKFCIGCNMTLNKKEYYIDPRNVTGLSTRCKECTKILQRKRHVLRGDRDKLLANARYAKNPEKRRAEKRNYMLANPEKHMMYSCRGRAKRRNIPFNLELSDIIIPDTCPILGITFVRGVKGDYMYSPSLDRIDNSKGYIKGNIQVISSLANTMKNSASPQELIAFAKYILKEYNNEIVQTIDKVESIEVEDKEPLR